MIDGRKWFLALSALLFPWLLWAGQVPPVPSGESILSLPWFWGFIIGGFGLGIFCLLLLWALKLRQELAAAFRRNQEMAADLESQVKERTIGIVKINEQINHEVAGLQKENLTHKELIKKLKAMLEVKSKEEFLPICSHCKNIRDNNGYWHSIEEFIHNLSDSDLSHTLCPDCTKELYPELFEDGAKPFCLSWKPGSDKPM